MIFLHFFALDQNFLDPQKTDKNEPYGPYRYKEIIRECYLISKNINTSYNEILDITPTERSYLLQFIADDIKRYNDVKEQAQTKAKQISGK
jgi:hypothetical protein